MPALFVRRAGKFDGPYDDEEIDEFLQRGELRFDDYIWTEGQAAWREVGEAYPDYALQLPHDELLTEPYLELLEAARHCYGRCNPVHLSQRCNVPYGIAAWACSEAEERFREMIKASLQLLLGREERPNPITFRHELWDLGFFDSRARHTVLQFLVEHEVIVDHDPVSSFRKPIELAISARIYTVDELIRQYASVSRPNLNEIPPSERVSYTGERRCVGQDGKLLYVVSSKGRVTDADGTALGTLMANGDAWDSKRQLVGRRADAGLLFAVAKTTAKR